MPSVTEQGQGTNLATVVARYAGLQNVPDTTDRGFYSDPAAEHEPPHSSGEAAGDHHDSFYDDPRTMDILELSEHVEHQMAYMRELSRRVMESKEKSHKSLRNDFSPQDSVTQRADSAYSKRPSSSEEKEEEGRREN
jgi:hypothetical protein